jgi:hypothetical protein
MSRASIITPALFQITPLLEMKKIIPLILGNRLMMRMACFGANEACTGALLTMKHLIFTAFSPAHPAYFLTQNKVLVSYLRITL